MIFAKSTLPRQLPSVLIVLILAAVARPAQAQVPRVISYQGTLTEDGLPASGTFEVTFGLYTQPEGGDADWMVTRQVMLREGRFSVLLGSTDDFPNDLFDGRGGLYLQVQVGDEPPLPRLRLASTAYALRAAVAEVAERAEVAEEVADGAIGRSALADGAVTTAKLDANAVTSAKIRNGRVQTADLAEGAVTTAKIDNGAVTSAKLGENSVTSSKIPDGAVRGSDLANGAAVTSVNDLSGSVTLEGRGIIDVEKTGDNTITISVRGGGRGDDDAVSGQPSARRWKTNIQPLEDALAQVLQLQGISFEWKDSGRPDIGLIAEEVARIVPELVRYENGRAQTLNYGHLTALLIEAIKTQQAQINRQRRAIARLEARVERLERSVNDGS